MWGHHSLNRSAFLSSNSSCVITPFSRNSLRVLSSSYFSDLVGLFSCHLHFTMYRWTKSVTYTGSFVFAGGYAYLPKSPLAVNVNGPVNEIDRKSTRLNSSH